LPTLRKFDVVGLKNRISELLTPAQTAAALHTTKGVLAVWRSKKRYPLKFVRIGRRIFYRVEDVQKFIELRTDPGVRS
jgi:hypothetical protein